MIIVEFQINSQHELIVQELQQEGDMTELQHELARIQSMLDDKQSKLARAEDVIGQMTHELTSSQEETRVTEERVRSVQELLEQNKEQRKEEA